MKSLGACVLIVLCLLSCTTSPTVTDTQTQTQIQTAQDGREASVNAVLDSLHKEASAADYERYFALYTDDAVFLGTDRDEYWPIEEFRAYTKAHFDKGNGWTYTPLERRLHFSGNTAWFEEELRSEKYGRVRGTGVLVYAAGAWRVAQYNLTLPIPNPLFGEVADDIKAYYQRKPVSATQ